jgi:phage shock protein A
MIQTLVARSLQTKQKLTLKFHTELKNSEEYKKKFFLLFNEGKADEQVFKDFAEKEVHEIQALINEITELRQENLDLQQQLLTSVTSTNG